MTLQPRRSYSDPREGDGMVAVALIIAVVYGFTIGLIVGLVLA